MPQDGEIDLTELKARYSVRDVVLVDLKDVELANEFRFTGEVALSIGLTFFGSIISSVHAIDWRLALTAIVFILFGCWQFYRSFIRRRAMSVTKD